MEDHKQCSRKGNCFVIALLIFFNVGKISGMYFFLFPITYLPRPILVNMPFWTKLYILQFTVDLFTSGSIDL